MEKPDVGQRVTSLFEEVHELQLSCQRCPVADAPSNDFQGAQNEYGMLSPGSDADW